MRVSILLVSFVLFLSGCTAEKSTDLPLCFTNDVLLPYTSVRNQGRTQTCWAYTMASMLESEYLSRTSDTVRLSVMYAVRKKYMKQFDLYYYSKGNDEIRGGGLGHSFLQVQKSYGMMPDEAYKGYLPGTQYHDHRVLLKRLRNLAEEAVAKKDILSYRNKAEMLLDEYMGKVPDHFTYRGKEYTAQSFADSLALDANRYIELTSFTHHPFYSWFVLEVPDNWEHTPFYNIPLDTMETYVRNALRGGYTVAWDGDTSEDGFMPRSGVALFPATSVTQQERQQGFENFETTDDHMMHIVGTAYDEKGQLYYILKNSWGKHGPYKGLVYMSQSYFRAKTISVVVPKECIKRIINKALTENTRCHLQTPDCIYVFEFSAETRNVKRWIVG